MFNGDNRGRLLTLFVTAVLFTLPTVALAEDGENTSPYFVAVVLTNADFYSDTYYLGDTVNFTVYVFYKDHPIDPDNISVQHVVHQWLFPELVYNLTVVRVSEGVYRGSIMLDNEFWVWTENDVIANVTVDGVEIEDSKSFYVFLPEEEDFYLDLSSPIADIDMAAPGDEVPLILRSTLNGTPYDIDLDSLSTTVYIYNPFDDFEDIILDAELEFVREATGVYTAVFTVPENLTQYGEFDIEVEYDHGSLWDWAYYSFDAGPYSVWGNFITRDSTQFVFDVYVYNSTGSPVEGAQVRAIVSEAEERPSGTTNDTGVVRLTLEENLTGKDVVHIDLNVSYGGVAQFSYITFSWPPEVEMPQPPTTGFAAWIENLEMIGVEGGLIYFSTPGDVQLHLRAYYNGSYYPGGEIVWYAYNGSDVVAGNTTTDEEGRFTLNFTFAEDGFYYFTFRAEITPEGMRPFWVDAPAPVEILVGRDNLFNLTLKDILSSEEISIETTELYRGHPLTVEYTYTGEYTGVMTTIMEVFPGGLNTSQPFMWVMESGPSESLVMGSLGPVHVERESDTSHVTRVTLTLPKLPQEIAGDNVTIVCGYMVYEPEFDELSFFTHITDLIKLNYVTLTWKEPLGTVMGKVVNETGSPIPNATVTVDGVQVKTTEEGTYEASVMEGTWNITVTKEGYIPVESTVEVPLGGTVYVNFTLQSLPEEWGNLEVTVKNSTGAPLEGATVTIDEMSKTTDEEGKVLWKYLPLKEYTVRVEKEGYKPYTSTVVLMRNSTVSLNVILEELPKTPWTSIHVTVTDYYTSEPIEGATVTITNLETNQTTTAQTDSSGFALFDYIHFGQSYNVKVEKEGYITNQTTIHPALNNTTTVNIILKTTTPPPVSSVYGGKCSKEDDGYLFEVAYNDTGGRAPQAVYVVIDGKRYNMTPEGDDYREGVRYTLKIKLDEGEHTYYFEVIGPDGEPVSAADNTPVNEGSAATLRVEKGGGGLSKATLAAIILIILLAIIAAIALLMRGKKGAAAEE